MPRTPRVHLEGVIYYVTLEGPSQEEIFWDSQDYQKYLELLAKHREEFKFKLFSYALLPGRLHLLIEVSDEHSISQIMQKITPLYTKYYNARYQRKGPLFQKRFRSVVVEKESYFPQLTRFVHLSPVQAGLVRNPIDYLHSSYRAFLVNGISIDSEIAPRGLSRSYGKKSIDGIASPSLGAPPNELAEKQSPNLYVEMEEVFQNLPNVGQQDAYERYVLSADQGELELLGRKLSRGAFLGSDEFIARIKECAKDQSKKNGAASETLLEEVTQTLPVYRVSKRLVTLSGVLVFAITLSAFSVVYNYQTMMSTNVEARFIAPSDSSLTSGTINDVPTSLPRNDETVVPPKADLNGTVWEVELVSEEPDGKMKSIKDKIKFSGKSFESRYFTSQGFASSNYTVSVDDSGIITWETIQKNEKGELVSWRGDWQGNKMEGVLSYRPTNENPRDFSFMSSQLEVQRRSSSQ